MGMDRYRDYSFDEFKNHVISGKSISEVSRIIDEPSICQSVHQKENFISKSFKSNCSFSTSVINRGKRTS